MADYAKSIDKKSAELLQAYKEAETEDEKQKTKKAYIRFYRQVVKSKEFPALSTTVADGSDVNTLLVLLRAAGILATE